MEEKLVANALSASMESQKGLVKVKKTDSSKCIRKEK
jgi:hypothetical protein